MQPILDLASHDYKALREQKASRSLLVLASLLFLFLLLWQTYSASKLHQTYQESLMESVTENIRSDYVRYFTQLRLDIDTFQNNHFQAITSLELAGDNANEEEYTLVYDDLLNDIEQSKLFTIVDNTGTGKFTHITGDFLADCKTEIASTLKYKKQTQLFLHHGKNNTHFDLLQPLLTTDNTEKYFFVSFETTILQELLLKYQLPHQQLFLIHKKDQTIELSTEKLIDNIPSLFSMMYENSSYSYSKPIDGTSWLLAIRLDDEYNTNIYLEGLTKALIIWFFLTLLIYSFYRIQLTRLRRQSILKQALHFKNNHDELTGLSNRVNFDKQITLFLEQKTTFKGVALHIDIDRFQVINNTFGFAIGDRYLHQLSMSLTQYLPDDATISRLANDEFAVLLPQLKHTEAVTFANALRRYIKQLTVEELPQDITISATVGVVILDEHQVDTEQVLSSLNRSVHIAKKKGRNRVQLYQSNDEQLIRHASDMEAIHELSAALKENRLLLYRQTIKPLHSHEDDQGHNGKEEPPHFEVLVRMKMKDGSIQPPSYFISAAEKYGLIRQLDHWVIKNTIKAMTQNPDDNSEYSINLSGLTLADSDTADFVKDVFELYKVNPKRICFEVTETSAISHLQSALAFIQQMTDLGCYFSLDDFGSGLSSFSYLQKLPVQIIKIDGAFIQDIATNHVNRIFVENIQRTAEAMNKKVVAEFIETEQIETILKEIGVHYGQGYYIHKPEFWV
jgi:diguanylate cyclase (GGDEF)-like protein